MKKFLLHSLILSLLFGVAVGQSIPTSENATSCLNCVPPGWNMVSGSASVSSTDMFAGSLFFDWNLPLPPSGHFRFITERHNASGHHDIVSAQITGLLVGRSYRVVYNVTSADPGNPPNTSGGYGIAKSATVTIQTNGLLTSQTTDYGFQSPGLGGWTHKELVFEAKSTTAMLTFTGTADWTYNGLDPLLCPNFPQQVCSPRYGIVGLDVEGVVPICALTNDQVELSQNSLQNACPVATVNLNSALKSPAPSGFSYKWFTDQGHSPNFEVADPTKVSQPGSYYAFLFDPVAGCYNTNVSQAKVVVSFAKCCSVTSQVQLNASSISNVCPAIAANLTSAVTDPPPHNYSVVWYTNPNHTGNPVPNPTSVGTGTYYAFLYNSVEDCFNTGSSTAVANVQLTPCVCKAGTNQVKLSASTATNKCSATTVNLTTLNLSNIPSGTSLVWFTNPGHTGSPVADPTTVTAGTYYAFLYDAVMDCYNTVNSTAQVKVTISPCITNVPLNIKVALQGAMPSAGLKMKNELQTYGGVGLLPTAAPYGILASYPDISKIDGVAGEIVDWISVEIRSGTSPGTTLQTKSLLLKPTGIIVDVNGQTPTFNPQTGPVRVVLKHRNHLAIMSNPIQSFTTGTVASYDFTTALSQASNAFGDPAQMVQKNGMWCMWAGDIAAGQDLGIDASDFNGVYDSNKQGEVDIYIATDINMDGGVDANDFNLVFFNNLTGPFSSLINY